MLHLECKLNISTAVLNGCTSPLIEAASVQVWKGPKLPIAEAASEDDT